MFETLRIQNFQRHTKLRIDFDPAITCIVGPTDAGKSAVLRALRWVCTNQPGGAAFIRDGATGATVRLTVDGTCVRRVRGGDRNEYFLAGWRFAAFGRAVPDEILDHLNLGPTTWQGQHDAPFWLADSPGEVSRQLNAVIDLGVIDDKLAHVNRELSRARTRLEVLEGEQTAAKAAKDDTAWVVGFDRALVAVEVAEAEAEGTTKRHATLGAAVGRANKLAWSHAKHALRAKAAALGVAAGTVAQAAAVRHTALAAHVAKARALAPQAARVVPNPKPLRIAHNRATSATTRAARLADLFTRAHECDLRIKLCESTMAEAEAGLPKKCPTCGRF